MGKFRPVVVVAALIACSLSASGLASAVEQTGEPPLAKNQATVTYVRWANFNSDKCLGIPNGNMTNGTGAHSMDVFRRPGSVMGVPQGLRPPSL
jgi:hypothetical protein